MISRRSFLTGISAAALSTTVVDNSDGVELQSMAHPRLSDDSLETIEVDIFPPSVVGADGIHYAHRRWMSQDEYDQGLYHSIQHRIAHRLPSWRVTPDITLQDYILIEYNRVLV